jgi:hypothetical protein
VRAVDQPVRRLTGRCSSRSRAASCVHRTIMRAASQLNARTLGLIQKSMQLLPYAPDCYGRVVQAAHANSLAAAVAELHVPSEHFVLFIAADTSDIPGVDLVDFAAALIRAGAAYICCWGPDCERFHHCFDEADFVVNGEASDSRVLMTTWHDDESLEDALWYALNSTIPAPAYEAGTQSVIAISIGDQGWSDRISAYLKAGAPMLD